MQKLITLTILLWAISASAITVCYDSSDATTVTSIGKTVPLATEKCFKHSGALKNGMDAELYTVQSGSLVPKSPSAVATIIQQRKDARQTRKNAKNLRKLKGKNFIQGTGPPLTLKEITQILSDNGLLKSE